MLVGEKLLLGGNCFMIVLVISSFMHMKGILKGSIGGKSLVHSLYIYIWKECCILMWLASPSSLHMKECCMLIQLASSSYLCVYKKIIAY